MNIYQKETKRIGSYSQLLEIGNKNGGKPSIMQMRLCQHGLMYCDSQMSEKESVRMVL